MSSSADVRTNRVASRGRGCAIAIALLVLPLVAEGVYRAVLFVGRWHTAPRGEVFEVFAVGESTMMGAHTRPKISIPALVAAMFGGRIGDRPIVVHMVARAGHPLYAQWLALGEATAFRDRSTPGVMLLYSGHNEGDQRGTEGADWQPGWYRRLERWSLLARALHLAALQASLLERETGLGSWEHELRNTIETALGAGLVPIVATAAGNISGVEPSFGGRDAEGARAALAAALREQHGLGCGVTEMRCGKREQVDADIAALLCHEAATCARAEHDFLRARDLYWKAVELDARHHWGRATPAQNALIRRLTVEYRVALVDAVALLEKASPLGLLGDALFVDGQHPSLRGQIIIARGFASAVSQAFGAPLVRELPSERDAMAAFDFTAEDESMSHVLSAGWLLGMAAEHPWPHDALALAESHTRAAIALTPGHFTAWLDLAIAQAGLRGGFLRDARALRDLGEWRVFFGAAACVPAAELDGALERLRAAGADPDVLERIGGLRAASCRPAGALDRY